MLRYHNKAQAEFNWILILVAGIIILSSFTAFAIDYKTLADRRVNTELSLSLSQQLDAYTSSGLTTMINPEGLNFFSTKISCSTISLNNAVPIQVKDKIIFSSNDISSDKLLVWVDEFSLPYRISNIYFISSPYIKYYILYDSETENIAKQLYNHFPLTQDNKNFFSIELLNQLSLDKINEDIQKQGLREVRIVTFRDIDIPSLNVKAKLIKLDGSLNLGDAFYPQTNEQYKYIKKQLLLAAIFSDNYKCNQDKLLSKINNINSIYQDKSLKLFSKTQVQNPECNYILLSSALSTVDTSNIASLLDFEQRITTHNLDLNRKGCQDVF